MNSRANGELRIDVGYECRITHLGERRPCPPQPSEPDHGGAELELIGELRAMRLECMRERHFRLNGANEGWGVVSTSEDLRRAGGHTTY
jgi:hypothetical protein